MFGFHLGDNRSKMVLGQVVSLHLVQLYCSCCVDNIIAPPNYLPQKKLNSSKRVLLRSLIKG